MSFLLQALGLVLVVEGLVLALAPSHLERVLRLIAALPGDRRRLLGLVSVAAGTAVLALWRALQG